MTRKGGKQFKHHRKRLGQYYTPSWAVDYVIQKTLGPTLNEDPDRLLGDFAVLDPACGDGAFLIGVLRFLARRVETFPKDRQHLLRRSIVDSIHGIDVDPKAVKSCQKHLEQTGKRLLQFKADFSQRVRLGNSLVLTDSKSEAIFGSNLEKISPVDWHLVYPWVMRDAGFDVIVGNPPFLGIKAIDSKMKDYLRSRFKTVHQQFDILIPFIELGLQLLRPGGRLGFIISNKILAADYGTLLRKTLVSNFVIEEMVDISHLNVFEDAATYPHILIIRKPRKPLEVRQNKVQIPSPPNQPGDLDLPTHPSNLVSQHYYAALPNAIFAPTLTEKKFHILQTLLQNTIPLGSACSIRCGIAKTGFTKNLISATAYEKLTKSKQKKTLPFLNAGDVRCYYLRQKKFLPYIPVLTSLDQWQDFQEPKLVIAGMAKRLRVAFDKIGHALGRVYYITQARAPYDPYFMLALLNSRLINAYFSLLFVATHLRSGYIRYNASYLEQIPFTTPTQHQEKELANLAKYVVENPKCLKKGFGEEIDHAIANLYGLSQKEVSLLEG